MEKNIIQRYKDVTKNEIKEEYNIDGKLNIKVSKDELRRGLKEKLATKHETAFIYEYCLSLKEKQNTHDTKQSPNKCVKK